MVIVCLILFNFSSPHVRQIYGAGGFIAKLRQIELFTLVIDTIKYDNIRKTRLSFEILGKSARINCSLVVNGPGEAISKTYGRVSA